MNLLREAHDYMEKHGWNRGTARNGFGEVCLIGALCYANYERSNLAPHLSFEKILREVCQEQYGIDVIPTVNDELLVNKEQALALLDKAAVIWEERNS